MSSSKAKTQEKPAKKEKKSLRSDLKPVWCPGCGDFGVIAGLDQALVELGYKTHEVVFVSGIGCSSRLPYFFNTFGFHTIHGRAPAVALGIKMAKPELRVIITGGDGDFFSIGTNHLIHVARRNLDVTAICMDNHIYGLTKGQVSPTSPAAFVTGSTPFGSVEGPLDPLLMVLSAGASFVAQSYSANVKHLKQTLLQAEKHTGFSFVNVISPCPTFNKKETFAYYKGRVSVTEQEETEDLAAAYRFIVETKEEVPLGVFFQAHRPTYDGAHAIMANASVEQHGVPTMEQILESFS
ncbi:MAG: 2-oxoacid:ferredoxin oxidoreductase subunit beta [Planctomycetota bacterium]|jgi:2-oxoglutarate ferredoxin oxidoreductase subunit beta